MRILIKSLDLVESVGDGMVRGFWSATFILRDALRSMAETISPWYPFELLNLNGLRSGALPGNLT